MKICWDNLEGMYLTKSKTLRKGNNTFIEIDSCKKCGNPYLTNKYKQSEYCCRSCVLKGIPKTEEIKKKLSISMKGRPSAFKGKTHTEEQKQKWSRERKGKHSGEKNPRYGDHRTLEELVGKERADEIKKEKSVKWKENNPNKRKNVKPTGYKHGLWKLNLASYDTYSNKLKPIDKCRRNEKNPDILEVKCTNCDEWFIPTLKEVSYRIREIIKLGRDNLKFYCSDNCKKSCRMYRKSAKVLINEDKRNAGIYETPLDREVQPELKQLCLERDGYTCIKCGSKKKLICHHIEGIQYNPIESADLDIVITVCENCHREIHQQKNCGYAELRCKKQGDF